MFQRQKVLLHLVSRAGGRIDKLRLMKLAFLARHERHLAAPTAVYGFVPYQFGPYSFALYHDLRKMTAEDVVTMDETSVIGKQLVPPVLDNASKAGVDALWDRYGSWTTSQLVKHVYSAFPWYTSNANKTSERRVERPIAAPAIYTVGYEGLSFDEFLDRLLRCGIQRVIDVRANPVARRYGFHRSTLQRNLGNLGIDYVHMPDLGIPGEERGEVTTPSQYRVLFDRYESTLMSERSSAIARVVALQREAPAALLCLEADPEQCHRSRLGRRVSVETGLPMRDLGEIAMELLDVATS